LVVRESKRGKRYKTKEILQRGGHQSRYDDESDLGDGSKIQDEGQCRLGGLVGGADRRTCA
jgi:hypothetical protein